MAFMDKKIVNPFLRSFTDVVLWIMDDRPTMNDTKSEASTQVNETDVAIVVGIAGQVVGKVVLLMKQDVAMRLASVMIGKPASELDSMVRSALGEMVNMIAGKATTELDGIGLTCDITPPSVISGKKLHVSPAKDGTMLGVSFRTMSGVIEILLSLKYADQGMNPGGVVK